MLEKKKKKKHTCAFIHKRYQTFRNFEFEIRDNNLASKLIMYEFKEK